MVYVMLASRERQGSFLTCRCTCCRQVAPAARRSADVVSLFPAGAQLRNTSTSFCLSASISLSRGLLHVSVTTKIQWPYQQARAYVPVQPPRHAHMPRARGTDYHDIPSGTSCHSLDGDVSQQSDASLLPARARAASERPGCCQRDIGRCSSVWPMSANVSQPDMLCAARCKNPTFSTHGA